MVKQATDDCDDACLPFVYDLNKRYVFVCGSSELTSLQLILRNAKIVGIGNNSL